MAGAWRFFSKSLVPDAGAARRRQKTDEVQTFMPANGGPLRVLGAAGGAEMIAQQTVATVSLRALPMFADTAEAALQRLAHASVRRTLERNAVAVRAGERADHVYLILAGRMNVMVNDAEGREAILSVLGPGELFGEMGVLDDGLCSATVKVVVPSVLIVIEKTVFHRCLQENFDVAHYVMRKLIQRLRVANRRIESLSLLDVSGRVARVLEEMAETVSGKQVVTRKTSRQDIAKMIGASREMVSRSMKDLELRGLVEQSGGRITLCGFATRRQSGRCGLCLPAAVSTPSGRETI